MVRRGIKNLRMGKSQKLSEAASEAVSAAIVRKNQPLLWPRHSEKLLLRRGKANASYGRISERRNGFTIPSRNYRISKPFHPCRKSAQRRAACQLFAGRLLTFI